MRSTPDISDAFPNDVVCIHADWRHFGRANVFSGPVSTIDCFRDNSRVAQALEEPGKGRVLLVDGKGDCHRALLGDRLAGLALQNGWAGIVVYGAVRDVEIFSQMDIGVMALRACPLKTDKKGEGLRDVAINIEQIKIEPGMWLYADTNGILIAEKKL
jgi:regulator of ribonuclease activity A